MVRVLEMTCHDHRNSSFQKGLNMKLMTSWKSWVAAACLLFPTIVLSGCAKPAPKPAAKAPSAPAAGSHTSSSGVAVPGPVATEQTEPKIDDATDKPSEAAKPADEPKTDEAKPEGEPKD